MSLERTWKKMGTDLEACKSTCKCAHACECSTSRRVEGGKTRREAGKHGQGVAN